MSRWPNLADLSDSTRKRSREIHVKSLKASSNCWIIEARWLKGPKWSSTVPGKQDKQRKLPCWETMCCSRSPWRNLLISSQGTITWRSRRPRHRDCPRVHLPKEIASSVAKAPSPRISQGTRVTLMSLITSCWYQQRCPDPYTPRHYSLPQHRRCPVAADYLAHRPKSQQKCPAERPTPVSSPGPLQSVQQAKSTSCLCPTVWTPMFYLCSEMAYGVTEVHPQQLPGHAGGWAWHCLKPER